MSGRPFCIAPWVVSHRRADGFRAPCNICQRTGDYERFGDWWNGPELRDARVTFLAGGVPDECEFCVHTNRTKGRAPNEFYWQQFGHYIQEILEATDERGRTTFMPRSADYRTMHCNLKCRTCDSRNSSSIRGEAIRAGLAVLPIAVSNRDERFADGEVLSNIEHVYWAGGEPFMSPAHRPVMSALVESGRSADVDVHYTSNLMVLSDRQLSDLSRYAGLFRSISLGASVDGTGRLGEYVRVGWKQAQFLENVRRLRKAAPTIGIHLDVTLTSLGFLCFPDLLEMAADLELPLQVKIMEENAEGNGYLSIDFLTPNAVIETLNRCRGLILPDKLAGVPALLSELVSRRYQPRYFDALHAKMLQDSEGLRGGEGLFENAVTGRLNLLDD